MATDYDSLPLEKPRSLHLEWAWPMLLHPRKTLSKALESTRGTWLAPLLILTVLAVVWVLVAGPLKATAASSVAPTLPPDFQYWSPDQQQQFMQSAAIKSTTTFTHLLPLGAELIKIWFGWLILSAILHLTLTLTGSRSSMTSALSLVGWASLPFAVRYLVQIGSMLTTHQLVANPGLSGFAPAGATGLVGFLAALLPFIDLYLVWMVVLLFVGLRLQDGVPGGKALLSLAISVVLLLVLEGLPSFLISQFSGLSTIRPFLF
jgi:hypothetical protein